MSSEAGHVERTRPFGRCRRQLQDGVTPGRDHVGLAHAVARVERLQLQVALGGDADHTGHFDRNDAHAL